MSQSPSSDPQSVLQHVFAFSADDVAANRKGEIAPVQASRITDRLDANSRFAWVVFAIVFGLGLFGFLTAMLRQGRFNQTFLLWYLGITLLSALVMWVVNLRNRHRMNRMLREGKVDCARGKIQIVAKRGEKLTHWYFCVGSQCFAIERADYRILLQRSGVEGKEAVVYFLSPSVGVLSVDLHS